MWLSITKKPPSATKKLPSAIVATVSVHLVRHSATPILDVFSRCFQLLVGQSDCGPEISERRVVGPQPRHQTGAQQLWRQSLCALAVLRRQRQRIELHHQVAGRLTSGGIVGDRVHLAAATGDEAT